MVNVAGVTDYTPVLRELAERGITGWRLSGPAAHGEVSGAAYICRPDGQKAVLTTSAAPVGHVRGIAATLDEARRAGALVPQYELVVPLPDTVAIVQELLPGRPARQVTPAVVDGIVAANDSLRGVLRHRIDLPAPELHLRSGGEDFCRHDSLASYDDRTRRLLAWVEDVGTDAPETAAGADLVHWDLTPGNILFTDDGGIGGLVDWNGLSRGDRWFGLIKLRQWLAREAVAADPRALRGSPAAGLSRRRERVDTDAGRRLDEHLSTAVAPGLLRAYWAHWSLSSVDWAIRHEDRSAVARALAASSARPDLM